MALSSPLPGQVIRYAYWRWNEARVGRADATKDRPCGVVEIPAATKQRLRLDAQRSWIITTELNQFIWPGPDLRPMPSGEYLYGYLPERLMRLVLDQVKKRARDKQLKTVPRTE